MGCRADGHGFYLCFAHETLACPRESEERLITWRLRALGGVPGVWRRRPLHWAWFGARDLVDACASIPTRYLEAMRTYLPLLALLLAVPALADVQRIAPGNGLQNATVVDTGANGICETTAANGDLQSAKVGQGSRNRPAVRCGPNRDADSTAQGDDVQLIAVGGTCRNANAVVIDTGANGIPETVPVNDDTFAPGIALGVPPGNTPCVIAGADGIAQTTPPAGDDIQLVPVGFAEPNTDVVRCGPNRIAETSANNVSAGD